MVIKIDLRSFIYLQPFQLASPDSNLLSACFIYREKILLILSVEFILHLDSMMGFQKEEIYSHLVCSQFLSSFTLLVCSIMLPVGNLQTFIMVAPLKGLLY